MSDSKRRFGTPELQLPEALRQPLLDHLEQLREYYLNINWGNRVGFGERPALLVIDLALFWTQPRHQMGSDLDSVVEETCRVLAAARDAGIPIFFTTYDFDPATPAGGGSNKLIMQAKPGDEPLFELDPRMERRPTEKLIRKPYASCFNGTNLQTMLASICVDTLIVTGASTSHCVYATCRDAKDSFKVIVPKEAVGERCEIMHEVNLLDIDIDLGDVMPVDDVVAKLAEYKA